MNREEYHSYRRDPDREHNAPVRLRKCWEVKLRHVYHYWRGGRRISGKDMPPGHYETRVIDCRMKGPFTMLWDVEISKPIAMPNIQQVPYKSQLGTLLKEIYAKHIGDKT